jgi:vancomycin resistance protein YoaR
MQPKASPEALQTALEQYARPAVSAPITLVTGSVKTELTPTQIGDALTISPDNSGRMVPHVDGTRLRGYLPASALAQEQAATNASFTIDNGQPVLVPARDGRGFSPDALAAAVLPALTQAAPRTATVSIGNLPAAFTTADAQALDVTDVLGTSSLAVTEAPNRFTNIARATTLIAGNVIQPGDTWSFLKVVGAPTTASGFVTSAAAQHAGVDPSGGVDTVATAVFDAAFSSGMGDTVHHPHASYVDRYPVGLDAAVVSPGTDLQWTNTSDHPVYLYASYANDSLVVALLGEKQYDDVKVQVSPRTAIVQPTATSGSSSGTACDSGSGQSQSDVSGFQVDVTRTLVRGGSQVGTEQFHVTYLPQSVGGHCISGGSPSPGGAVSASPTKSPATSSGGGSGGSSGGGGHSGGGGSAPSPSPSPSPSGLLGGLIH